MKKYFFFVIWIILLLIDQVSKYYFFNNALWSHLSLLEPSLNTWISFSIGISYLIVIPMTLVALLIFVYLYKRKEISESAAILLIIGTLWNLIDRLLYSWVRDFIVMFDRFIYNIADVYITLWTVIVIWGMLWLFKKFIRKK